MSCIITNPANGENSKLYDKLVTVFGSETDAQIAYSKVVGPTFKERFGDWVGRYSNDMFEGEVGVVDEKTGEPKLHKDELKNKWYYLDYNGQKDYLDKMPLSEFSAQQIEQISNYFLFRFVTEGGEASLNNYDKGEVQGGILLKSIEDSIASYREQIKGRKNSADLLDKINLIEKNKIDFKKELITYIARLGQKVNERIVDPEGTPLNEVDEKSKGGGVNIRDTFETDSKDSATTNTKIMLHQIQQRVKLSEKLESELDQKIEEATSIEEENELIDEYNELIDDAYENDKAVPVKDGFLEIESFANFDDVWTTLNTILVDEVGYGHGNSFVDIYTVMINKLEMFSNDKDKLWIKDLLEKLEAYDRNGDNNKIYEFVQAFNKTELNFFITETDNKGGYKVLNATSTNSRKNQLLRKWNGYFSDRFLIDGKLEDSERIELQDAKEELKGSYSRFLSKAGKWKSVAKNSEDGIYEGENLETIFEATNDAAFEIIDVLRSVGVKDIHPEDVNRLIIMAGGQEKMFETIHQLYNSMDYMLKTITDPKFKFINKDYSLSDVFGIESSVRAFADAVGFRETDIAAASVLLTNGKTGYSISNPTYISNKINEWKKEKNKESLKKLTSDPSKKNSIWAKYLLALDQDEGKEREREVELRFEKFKTGLDASFKSKGKNDGVENTKITTNDQINANIAQLLNSEIGGESLFPTIIAADKSRRILLSGLPTQRFEFSMNEDGSVYIPPGALEIAVGYAEDEYSRIQKVVRENKDDSVTKIVHYHGEKGNGLKFQVFPEFNEENTNLEHQEIRTILYGDNLNTEDAYSGFTDTQRTIVGEHIAASMSVRILEHNEKLKGLDGLSKDLKKEFGNVFNLAGNYFINGLVSSVEYTKLFSGDPAYYKTNADLIKRIPATYTDGLQLRLKSKDEMIFNQATVNGVEVASKYLDLIKASVTDKSIVKAYEEVNTTDAQAWITPRRWKFLKKRLGQWSPLHDNVFDKMNSGKEITNPVEMKLAAQPLKGVYFEINDGRPVYLKYSQAVLIPSLVKGTPMEGLYNKMTKNPETGEAWGENEGHKEIHEVVTIDGIKVGSVVPTPINVEGTTEMLAEKDIVLTPARLNNRGWKLQQDLPVKLMHETNVGSQIQKNILEGLDLEGTYDGQSGRKLLNDIHKTISKLSNFGKKKLIEKLGIDKNGKITNTDKVYDALIEEFKDRGGSENIIDALSKKMKLDAIPQIRGKVESVFMSMMNRSLTKISTQGGSFIQVSPFGLEKISEDSGILVVSNDYNKEGLLPPRIDKESGDVLPGQAMIPHSYAVKLLKQNGISLDGMTLEEAVKLLDPSALEMITYRIPNQGMSSNDYLQIVGILPTGMGDSIVVYDGLPAKTGSDFDIDKLFGMQNHLVFDKKRKSLTKLTEENRYLIKKTKTKDEIDQMITENDLIKHYKAVLNSPLTYDNMMRSIDGAQLKDDIAGTKKNPEKGLFPAVEMKNMELFSPLTQLKTKAEYLSGKFGVAQTANQLVDHVSNQTLNIRMDKWLGQGNSRTENVNGSDVEVTFFDTETKDSHSIADNLSAFLNAYVDIAKDSYIARANHNSVTANTSFMLLRAGVPLKWVNRFMGQPILKELVELQMEQQSITAKNLSIEQKGSASFSASAMDVILFNNGFRSGLPKNISGKDVAILTESALEANIRNGVRDKDLDYKVLKAWSFLSEQAKFFGQGVAAAKSDTAGAGASNVERLVNSNKIDKVFADGVLKGYQAKFNGTMLGTYRNNTLNWVKDVVRNSNLFLSGTQVAENSFNLISFQTANGELLTNLDLAKAIDNSYYSYLMSGLDIFKDNFKNYKNITTNVPKRVAQMQSEQAESSDQNFLIKELEIDLKNGKKYLGINNKNKPTHYQDTIYRAWMKLYNAHYIDENGRIDTERIHPDKKIAIGLAKYAFTGSGFQNNLAQFFTIMPHQILKDANISKSIDDEFRDNVMDVDHNFTDQLQRHSSADLNVVKSVNLGLMEGNALGFIYKPSKSKSKELGSIDKRNKTIDNRFFPKFVSVKKKSESDLYQKIGTVRRLDSEGNNIKVPVYVKTFKLGTKDGKYRTFEYSKFTNITKSNVNTNNLEQEDRWEINGFIKKVSKEETFESDESFVTVSESVGITRNSVMSDEIIISENLTQIIISKNIQCI